MRNAKKIFILLLSLALLCGIFAVATLAEDSTATENDYVTVVYPGGVAESKTFKLGDTISLEALGLGAFETKTKANGSAPISLSAGPNNTLFQDDGEAGFLLALLDASDSTQVEKYLDNGAAVTADLLGRTIEVQGATAMKVVLWEADGVNYNFISKNDDVARQLCATAG
ncbi:MAG: hypothetical protein IJZ24_04580, partial [Clostridia bacterium]|nr:hypothetical protein [Clostridia bacterium]